MRALVLIGCVALAACGPPTPDATAPDPSTVRISLPDEPPSPFTGPGAAILERTCVACHSAEMIATQPPLAPDKWQATIDKMRTVYGARIDPTNDAALIAALGEVSRKR